MPSNETPPHIPDLDPRADAHIIGTLALPGFLVLIAGIAVLVIIVLGLGHWLIGGWSSLALTVLLAGLWTLWIIADGPALWMRRRRWHRRRQLHAQPPGFPMMFPADHAADPFWTEDGMAWATARLTLPPVLLLDDAQMTAWHLRLAQAARMATVHGVGMDVTAAQLPGSTILPSRNLPPVMAARWQWWAQQLGPQSVQAVILVRLGWPDPHRDAASLHFLSVEQAWRAASGPGEWQWLSAALARDLAQAASHPAQAYARWQKTIYDHLHQEQQPTTTESRPRRASPPI